VDAALLDLQSAARQPAEAVQLLRNAEKDSFGVAAAQSAGATEGAIVDDGDLPTSSAASASGGRTRRAGADDEQVEGLLR
jgi:hypothetical protein